MIYMTKRYLTISYKNYIGEQSKYERAGYFSKMLNCLMVHPHFCIIIPYFFDNYFRTSVPFRCLSQQKKLFAPNQIFQPSSHSKSFFHTKYSKMSCLFNAISLYIKAYKSIHTGFSF